MTLRMPRHSVPWVRIGVPLCELSWPLLLSASAFLMWLPTRSGPGSMRQLDRDARSQFLGQVRSDQVRHKGERDVK